MKDRDYEQGDSRRVTLKKESGGIEPPRTGPRVEETRDDDARGEDTEPLGRRNEERSGAPSRSLYIQRAEAGL